MNYKEPWVRCLNLLAVSLQMLIPFLNRKKVGEFDKVYAGFIWGSYPKDSVQYVLEYLKNHPNFWKDLQTCKIPEEMCFQTILMNSEMRNRIVNNNLRYWKFEGGDGSGPVYLNESDFESIVNQNVIFARKVKFDSELRQMLEINIKEKVLRPWWNNSLVLQ